MIKISALCLFQIYILQAGHFHLQNTVYIKNAPSHKATVR